MTLSKESQDFIENLRLYLISSGKNEQDAEEIIEELHDHLHEAEQHGRSVDHIIGQSPKSYMKEIAGEMSLDHKQLAKWFIVIAIGAFSIMLISDAVKGDMSYSILSLVGYPTIMILFLLLTATLFRYLASHKPRKAVEFTLTGLLGFFPVLFFLGILLLEEYVFTDLPMYTLDGTGRVVTGLLCLAILIAFSIQMKTMLLLLVVAFLNIPALITDAFTMGEEAALWVEGLVPMVLFGGYAFFVYLRTVKTSQ
ncbi:HAAS domain-containing protein [Pontibacillus halophilus]|nr:hypothetical protein [Pontibacillus halophilus]